MAPDRDWRNSHGVGGRQVMSTTSKQQRRRVERVFARLDRDRNQVDPQKERDLLVAQVMEVLDATGERAEKADVEAALDDILEEERLETERMNAPKWWQAVPGWAWGPIAIVSILLLIPISRILLRIAEALVRLI